MLKHQADTARAHGFVILSLQIGIDSRGSLRNFSIRHAVHAYGVLACAGSPLSRWRWQSFKKCN